MMNLKTTALLGNLTRQSVSRQLGPLSTSKNQVITLTQRSAQPATANAPANPVRSFSSSQANRENNNSTTNATVHHHHHGNTTPFYNNPLRLQGPIAANINFQQEQQRRHNQTQTQTQTQQQQQQQPSEKGQPRHKELLKSTWDAINGQDARAVFPYLHEMRQQGFYADSALSSHIVAQFLMLNNPQDAERALVLLVDCHHNQGRQPNLTQRNVYVTLAKNIANHSSDFTQALSLAKMLDRHHMLMVSGLSDGTLRAYREMKATAGLSGIKSLLVDNSDLETLLTMQASLTQSSIRYRHLIEILLDGKEMEFTPSQECCSRISLSFLNLGDYSGQLAWDTAVQEIHPGFKPSVPQDLSTVQFQHPQQKRQPQQRHPLQHQYQNQHTSNYHNHNGPHQQQQQQHQQQRQGSAKNNYQNGPRRFNTHDPYAQIALRQCDPSEAIIRACRFGYAGVAMDEITKMLNSNQLPSPRAVAETIQVCAKREKQRTTNYQELYDLARRSLDVIQDKTHRRAAEYEVYNAMLVANATLGDMTAAKKNYDDIVQMGQFPDATGYATLLIATTTGAVDEANDALKILEEVKRHNIKPNIFFYNVVIGKLSRGRKIERVMEVYDDMTKHNIRPNAITYGALISAYTRVGSEDMARSLFKEMINSSNYHPRQGPHNAMIQFYVRQKKDREEALDYYQDMVRRRLSPTEHTYTLLIEAFACIPPYDMTEANRLIKSLKTGPVRATEAHYGALIHAYGVEHRDISTAEVVFNNMLAEGIVPKGPAYQSMIESYISNQKVDRAVQVRNELLESGQPTSAYIENTLIRGFGQAKDIQAAESVFNRMVDPYAPDAKAPGVIVKEPSTFQSMVTAYLDNKMVDQATATLGMMKEQHYPELVVKPVEEAIQAAMFEMACNTNELQN
ncbi:hypothetical protein EDD11_004252 [Mortierella claussenii]|nr:hypothetical protein EDD11_004252 [Mortierella claussenii]